MKFSEEFHFLSEDVQRARENCRTLVHFKLSKSGKRVGQRIRVLPSVVHLRSGDETPAVFGVVTRAWPGCCTVSVDTYKAARWLDFIYHTGARQPELGYAS